MYTSLSHLSVIDRNSVLVRNIFYLTRYLMKFGTDYRPKQRYNVWRHFLDRTTISNNCHTNWTIKMQFLYENYFICEGYSNFKCFYLFFHFFLILVDFFQSILRFFIWSQAIGMVFPHDFWPIFTLQRFFIVSDAMRAYMSRYVYVTYIFFLNIFFL